MSHFRNLRIIAFCWLILCFSAGCQWIKQNEMMVGQLKPATADEAEIYGVLTNLKDFINTSQWDKWLSLYTDDAILTDGKTQVSKQEMRDIVEDNSYNITEMEILEKSIGLEGASISVRMIGNGTRKLETYKFKKINGKWLIFMETNP